MGRAATGSVQKLPSKHFRARFSYPDGKRVSKTFPAKKYADAWIAERVVEVNSGRWSSSRSRSSVTVAFGDYARNWLENRLGPKGRELSPRTKVLYDDLLLNFILPTFENRPVHLIEREDVNAWYRKVAEGRATRRAQSYSLLRTILNSAVDDGHLLVNPARIKGAGQTEREHKIRPAKREELRTIIEAMPDRLQLLVQLAAACGLRYGELIELRRKDFDLPDRMLHVERSAVLVNRPGIGGEPGSSEVVVKPPKSAAGVRDVVIPRHLVSAVAKHLMSFTAADPEALLFPSVDDVTKHMKPSTLAKTYFKAREKAGRPDLRFHDLRHTASLQYAQEGATIPELMDRLGHSTSAAAMRYQHLSSDMARARELADKVSDYFEEGESAKAE